jgi:NAD(P)-dependent dehydrogenase (short-subunit alcohol dehydrogenase family)
MARFGRIDGLVNSAFASATGPTVDAANLDDWRGVMDTNFFGSLNMSRAVFPAMKAQRKGSIVNVNTMATRKPMPGRGAYMASKAALAALTRLMAQEWGPHGIRVNTVTMGWMWSAGLDAMFRRNAEQGGTTYEAGIAKVVADIPLGHIPPDRDCARSALAILSDQCSQVTGANLDVNGGEFMAL